MKEEQTNIRTIKRTNKQTDERMSMVTTQEHAPTDSIIVEADFAGADGVISTMLLRSWRITAVPNVVDRMATAMDVSERGDRTAT